MRATAQNPGTPALETEGRDLSTFACYSLTQHTTEELNSDGGRRWIRRLLAEGASREELIEAFASQSPPDLAGLVRREFAEMPDPMFQTIMASWLAADGSGKAFELRSVRPERPLEFAHRGRVRLTVDYEEDRAVVSVSHIAGRHARWYRPAGANG